MTLQYNPYVTLAFRHVLMIKIFQQRDGVLSGNVSPRFEIRNSEPAALVGGERLADMCNNVRMKNKIA